MSRSVRSLCLASLVIGLWAPAIHAQPVLDPRVAEFEPSSDHNLTTADGRPLVDYYELQLYRAGSAQPIRVVHLGKPSPLGDGRIRVDLMSLLNPQPAPGLMYEARIAAVGPGGSTQSSVSNTFQFQAACSVSLAPAALSIQSGGGTAALSVSAPAGCTWTVTGGAGWLAVTRGSGGSGNGEVTFSAGANQGASPRSASVVIGGQTVMVTQASTATTCDYTLAPGSRSIGASGGVSNATVATQPGCSWTAVSNAGWISISGPTGGTGTGTVTFAVEANATQASRASSIAIAGRTLTVTQAGASCTYQISPSSRTAPQSSSSGSVTVTAPSGCTWSVSSQAGWLTVVAGTNGAGDGSVGYSVAANPGTNPRTGRLVIAGHTFTVTQAGTSCSYSVNPTSQTIAATGTTLTVSVSAPSGCAWSSSERSSWIRFTGPTSGSGPGTVRIIVSSNGTTRTRSTTVTVAGQGVLVNQGVTTPPDSPSGLRVIR